MPPKFLESNFDSTALVLQEPGIGKDSSGAFVQLLSDVVKNYDFTNVDTDAATNMVSAAARKMSQQGFQQAEKAIKHSIDWLTTVIEGGTAATGQWYATAATVVGKEALDYAEKRFNTYMGWDDEEVLLRGEWVAIDYGIHPTKIMDVDRRRLPSTPEDERALIHGNPIVSGRVSTFSAESAEKYLESHESQYSAYQDIAEPLRKKIHLGLATGERQSTTNGSWVEVLDLQTGGQTYLAQQKVVRLPKPTQAKMDNDQRLSEVKQMFTNPNVHLPDQVLSKISTRVGDKVVYDGEPYTIERAYTKNVLLVDGVGTRVQPDWTDSKLAPAHNSTSYKPTPSGHGNYITQGGYNRGDYVWVQGQFADWDLNCISSVKGQHLEVYDATTGESGQISIHAVRPVARDMFRGGMWAQFADAVVERDRLRAKSYAPGKKHPHDCRAREGETHKFGNPPKSTFTSWGSETESDAEYEHGNTAWNSKLDDAAEDTQNLYGYAGGVEFETTTTTTAADYSVLFIVMAGACAAYAITR